MVVFGARDLTRREQAYELLDRAAREHWRLEAMSSITRSDRGKPFFLHHPERQFNLSHSGTWALCALDDSPVGVDIQTVSPRRKATLDRVCSPQEREWLREHQDSQEHFALLWALKESAVKQTGTGLTFPIANIQVPLPIHGETLLAQDGLWFRIYQNSNWQAAVCGRTAPPVEIFWMSMTK